MTRSNTAARTLADQLGAVLAYRNTPDHTPEPLVSNFVTEPANDNKIAVKVDKLQGEKLLKVTPSIEEILRAMRCDWVWKDDPVEQPVIAIGNLHFSDGKKTEKAHTIGPDGDVIQYDRVMPRGAMLGCTETLTEAAGGQAGGVKISNGTFAERLGTPHRSYIPGGRRRSGKSYTPAETQALLDKAIANTPVLPPVTYYTPGVASGTAQYSDQFVGMKIGSTGKGGAPSWVDVYTARVEQEIERKAHDELSDKDKSVLNVALTAAKLEDISPGGSAFRARERGKRLLVAANDNFAMNRKKFG